MSEETIPQQSRTIILPPGELSYDTISGMFEHIFFTLSDQLKIAGYLQDKVNDFFEDVRHEWSDATTAKHRSIRDINWSTDKKVYISGEEVDSYDGDRGEYVDLSIPIDIIVDTTKRREFFTNLKNARLQAIADDEKARAQVERDSKIRKFEQLKKELGR